MTEQEYQEEVNKIANAALLKAEECAAQRKGVEGCSCSSEEQYDCASDIACELSGEHPWLEDVDKCFEMLKVSPHKDEVFREGIYSIFDHIKEFTFKNILFRMAEEVFWFDVIEAINDKAPEEVKEAWREAEEEEK